MKKIILLYLFITAHTCFAQEAVSPQQVFQTIKEVFQCASCEFEIELDSWSNANIKDPDNKTLINYKIQGSSYYVNYPQLCYVNHSGFKFLATKDDRTIYLQTGKVNNSGKVKGIDIQQINEFFKVKGIDIKKYVSDSGRVIKYKITYPQPYFLIAASIKVDLYSKQIQSMTFDYNNDMGSQYPYHTELKFSAIRVLKQDECFNIKSYVTYNKGQWNGVGRYQLFKIENFENYENDEEF